MTDKVTLPIEREEVATPAERSHHRYYFLMLVLIKGRYDKGGAWDSETIWVRVKDDDVAHLFTFPAGIKPMKHFAFIEDSLLKMVAFSDDARGQDLGVYHFMMLEYGPESITRTLHAMLNRLREGEYSWTKFQRRSRKYGWVQIMKRVAPRKSQDELAQLARGMLYGIIVPENTFNKLREKLSSYGIMQPIEAIEDFISFVKKMPDDGIRRRDIELAIGKSLSRRAKALPVSTASEEIDMITSASQIPTHGLEELFEIEGYEIATAEQKKDSYRLAASSGIERHDISAKSADGEHASTPTQSLDIRGASSIPSVVHFEQPQIDESISLARIKKLAKTGDTGLYVDLVGGFEKPEPRLELSILSAFIALANRALRDNRKTMLVMGPTSKKEHEELLEEEKISNLVIEHVYPHPDFVSKIVHLRKSSVLVFAIQPVGKEPFIAKTPLTLKDGTVLMEQNECWLRIGLINKKLDHSEFVELVKSITLKFGW